MEFIIGKDGNSLKKLTQVKNIKLIIQAGQAKPTPPVGPALGQYGVNLMDFCKQFNELTKSLKTTIPISTEIRINPDKTFKINLKAPSNTHLLKVAANRYAAETQAANSSTIKQSPPQGAKGGVTSRTVTLKQIYEIATIRALFTRVSPQGSNQGRVNKLASTQAAEITSGGASYSQFKKICKNVIGSANSLKYKIISDISSEAGSL